MRRCAHADCSAVLTKQPPELMNQWLSMIPGRRICHPAELKSVRTSAKSCPPQKSDLISTGLRFPCKRRLLLHDRRRHRYRWRVHTPIEVSRDDGVFNVSKESNPCTIYCQILCCADSVREHYIPYDIPTPPTPISPCFCTSTALPPPDKQRRNHIDILLNELIPSSITKPVTSTPCPHRFE